MMPNATKLSHWVWSPESSSIPQWCGIAAWSLVSGLRCSHNRNRSPERRSPRKRWIALDTLHLEKKYNIRTYKEQPGDRRDLQLFSTFLNIWLFPFHHDLANEFTIQEGLLQPCLSPSYHLVSKISVPVGHLHPAIAPCPLDPMKRRGRQPSLGTPSLTWKGS